LEERILAGLKAERERDTHPAWWRWPALAALGAMVIIAAMALGFKPRTLTPETAARRPAHTEQSVPQQEIEVTSHPSNGSSRKARPVLQRHVRSDASSPAIIEADVPRLEQFPSPQPLSEQEQILASYVANYPEHAALIAEARAELLRREAREDAASVQSSEAHSQEQSR
jgi:hypothetical protein